MTDTAADTAAPAAPTATTTTTTTDLAGFRAALRDVLAAAQAESIDRERNRELLHDRVRQLQGLGFGALRLPAERGGAGIRLRELFELLIDIAEADSSLSHVFRGHIAFVEGLLIGDGPDLGRWVPRLRAGEFVGNAQSERQATADLSTRVERDGDGVLRLTGTKYYTTGSIYADWIYLTAMDGEDRLGVTVRAEPPAVASVDDWDGFGQQLTGSGTTVFEDVALDESEVVRLADEPGFRPRYLQSIFQLCLLAVVAGIAQAIVRDTVAFVRPRRRLFGHAGETLPRENELVQTVVGELSAAAHTARTLVLASAEELDAVFAAQQRGAEDAAELALAAQLNVYKAQNVVLRTVLAQAAELFEVGGASAVSRTAALDRHWRNVRTIASHNPAIQRKRAIGDYLLNERAPSWGRAASNDTEKKSDD